MGGEDHLISASSNIPASRAPESVRQSAIFTQRTNLHLSGEDFSTLSFDIFADGKPTEIKRVTHTNGRSGGYLTTSDQFVCGDDVWERGKNSEKLLDWLTAHTVERTKSESTANPDEAKP